MRSNTTKPMVLWLIGAILVVFVTSDPWSLVLVIASASVVAATGDKRSAFKGFLLLGLGAMLMRTVLFALTGHDSSAGLFQLPSLHLPSFFGGLTIGGSVSSVIVSSAIAEGLKLAAVMAVFGAFLATSDAVDLLRAVPPLLFEAALVLNIALVFAPQLARTAAGVREAQRMRGARRRGRRSLAPFLVPVLATALERSIALAESMDSRGFGNRKGRRRTRYPSRRISAAELALAASPLMACLLILATRTFAPVAASGAPFGTPNLLDVFAATLVAAPCLIQLFKHGERRQAVSG
ncbi:MAG: energy-coupling factor transporter transmembrane component T [Actinomycetota bacterium]